MDGLMGTPPVAAVPRLVRHTVTLDDGHEVSVAVAGRGIPFVVVHGFMAEGFTYAQTLRRLVTLGYLVVAIDAAGHGRTHRLVEGQYDFDAYVHLFERTLDHLGIRRAVLAGHSMGSLVIAHLVAADPGRAVALLLIDPILGKPWDRLVARSRLFPPLLLWRAATIALDTAATFPLIRDRAQARKLARLLAPTLAARVAEPWRLLAPAVAILRSGSSQPLLESIRRHGVPAVVVHGERDLIVPLATARDAAERLGADLVVVHRGTHSWLLGCPDTLPAVIDALHAGRLGAARDAALYDAGLDPSRVTPVRAEAAFCVPGAPVLDLARAARGAPLRPRPARFRFTRVDAAQDTAARTPGVLES